MQPKWDAIYCSHLNLLGCCIDVIVYRVFLKSISLIWLSADRKKQLTLVAPRLSKTRPADAYVTQIYSTVLFKQIPTGFFLLWPNKDLKDREQKDESAAGELRGS